MRLLVVLLFFLSCFYASVAGANVSIHFTPQYKGQEVKLEEQYYPLPGGDSVVFDVLKFYVSDIVLYKDGKEVYKEPRSYHLLNVAENNTGIELATPDGLQYDHIRFHIGIDSATNTSGALNGDLDPAKGMYWAWQSGYINLKLEGRSNACPTRNHEFSFHLGGYLPPGYALQTVLLPASGKEIQVAILLDTFLQNIDLHKENSVMIPGKEAVQLAQKMAGAFAIKTE